MTRRPARLPMFLAGAAVALPAASVAQSSAPYTVVESGRGYERLQDAVNAIGGGRGTIRFASFAFSDCAVQTEGEITYTAAVPGKAVLDGVACEGKGALVLRGRGAHVEGLVFANIQVGDKNGAGIRLERGNLTVSQAWFRDSEQGILTGNDPGARLTVDKSTFTRLGSCEGSSCAHSIYVNGYGAVTVTRSRFEAGRGGHYVKTRAPRVTVLDSSFDDTGGRGTNYMIDLSNGATGEIAGNWFVQGQDKENYTAFITVAPEGRKNTSEGLVVEANDARFGAGISRDSTFVAAWTDDRLAIGQNTLGPGLRRTDRR